MSAPDLKWEDPPERARNPGRAWKWGPIIESLRKRPGEWALVDTRRAADHQNPTAVFGPTQQRLKGQGVQVTVRTVDGEVRLYARWPERNGAAS